MITVASSGVPSVTPAVGAERETLKAFVPEKGFALLTGIEIVFEAASPSDQLRVPFAAEKSVLATAPPLAAA